MTQTSPTMPQLKHWVSQTATLNAYQEHFTRWAEHQRQIRDGDRPTEVWYQAIEECSNVQRTELELLFERAVQPELYTRFEMILERFGVYHKRINGKEDRSYVGLARSWLLEALYDLRRADYLSAIRNCDAAIKELRFVTDGRKRKSSDTFRHLRPEVREELRTLTTDVEALVGVITKARAA